MNNEWNIRCIDCGKEKKYLSYDGYYEAKRLNRIRCNSCANKKRWSATMVRSKYDRYFKKGDKIGLLEVISDKVEVGCRIKCKCKCGKIITRRVRRILDGKFLGCKQCLVENLGLNWKGIGKVPKMAFIKIKNGSARRKKEFNITLEYISKLFDEQNGICVITGMPIAFYENGKPNQTASLDRIDSSLGYVINNVQWVHKDVNFMKQSFSTKYFKEICKLVTEYDTNRNKQ